MTQHILRRTTTEEFSFDPATIREHFGWKLDEWDGTYEDFVISLFEEHDGSIFGDRFFYDTTNTDSGLEVIEREDDA